MQGTTGGRQLTPRYYCSTRRADRSCDQPIIPAEPITQRLVEFIVGFATEPTLRGEILDRLAATPAAETSDVAKRRATLEQRLKRMRDLYELGDLARSEYLARRNAINAELDAFTPEPTPDLDQARKVLEDFTTFWNAETDPTPSANSSPSSSKASGSTKDRIIAVQPKPSFAAFFQQRRERSGKKAGVKSGSDGTGRRERHRIEIRE